MTSRATPAALLVRSVIRAVALLHERGHESLYLDPVMSPSGMHWRYEIGAMERGRWPATSGAILEGSIGGEAPSLRWTSATGSAEQIAGKFLTAFPKIARAARRANPEYVAWFREMESRTAPSGIPVFWCDYGPDHEHLFLWGGPSDFRMEMPQGYRAGAL